MKVLLRDLAPGQEYAIQFRSNNGENVSEWSQVTRFTTTNDTIRPSDVTGLSWYDSGTAFVGAWDKVTTQGGYNEVDNNPATFVPIAPLNDFRYYRVNVSFGNQGADFLVVDEKFYFTKEMNIDTFGTLQTELKLSVWAVDTMYNESKVPATMNASPLLPPVPSTPALTNYLGAMLVTWDGRSNANQAMPANFEYVEVHVGTTTNFNPSPTTLAGRMTVSGSSARFIIPGLTYGTTYYVKLISVNSLLKKSAPSAPASGSVTRLSGLDIAEDGNLSKDSINFTALDIGGANAFYSGTAPTAGMVKGDLWYNTASAYAVSRFNGTDWVAAPEVGVVSGSKIIAGTITGDRIATNFFSAARAYIGSAFIDSAMITSVNAATITTGILQSSFTRNYNGVTQPLWSIDTNGTAIFNEAHIIGGLVVGNANPGIVGNNAQAFMQSYNFNPGVTGWIVRGDGSVEFGSATVRGNFRTGTSGRRVEIGTNASVGEIRSYSDGGVSSFFRSYTEPATGREGLQIGVVSPGAPATWNSMYYNQAEWSSYQTNIHEFVYETRFAIYDTYFKGQQPGGKMRLYMDHGSFQLRGGAAGDDNRYFMYNLSTGDLDFRQWSGARMVYLDGGGQESIKQFFLGPDGNGTMLKSVINLNVPGIFFEIRNIFDNGFIIARAGGFEINSDMRGKKDIVDVPVTNALAEIDKIRPRQFRRKHSGDRPVLDEHGKATGKVIPGEGPLETGIVAQEAPDFIVSPTGADGELNVDMMKMMVLLAAGIQELNDKINGPKK